MELTAFLKGAGLGAGLIVAIGSQNAFLLRQALKKEYVYACTMICIMCDVLLISAGVAGMGAMINNMPTLLFTIRIIGAAFLFWYGLRAAKSALHPAAMLAAGQDITGRRAVITSMLAVSILNPHVYLDTVVLLGSIGGQLPGNGRWYFALGAICASVAWFGSLGAGARLLAPLFARPAAWRWLDALIAVVMWSIALSLLL
jgi:L-lysine exporter family protein LysE/ArgO